MALYFLYFTRLIIGGDHLEKFLKALGRVLVYVLYIIVVLVIIGVIRWVFKALTDRS